MVMNLLKNTVIIIISALFTFVSIQPLSASEQNDKIKLDKVGPKTVTINMHYLGNLSPSEVTITPGTTVIWRNDSRASLEIQFEGKPVTIACKSPILFNIDKSGSFMSNHLSQGSRASLCFVEKGEFNYVARKVFSSSGAAYELRENIQEFKGKVIVK
jgi:plastocyanin